MKILFAKINKEMLTANDFPTIMLFYSTNSFFILKKGRTSIFLGVLDRGSQLPLLIDIYLLSKFSTVTFRPSVWHCN